MIAWGKVKFHLFQIYLTFVKLIVPPSCAGCGRVGLPWCKRCHAKVEFLRGDICERCGIPSQSEACPDCSLNPPPYEQARSLAVYDGVFRKVPVSIKYDKNINLAETISTHLIELLISLNWEFDWIIPIPLSNIRLKSRGYNQVDLFARPVANYFGKPYKTNSLLKTRNAISQVGLDKSERIKNVINAFQINSEQPVTDKNILLIDDVFTTGATLWFAARTLKKAGAGKIFVITLARALPSDASFTQLS